MHFESVPLGGDADVFHRATVKLTSQEGDGDTEMFGRKGEM